MTEQGLRSIIRAYWQNSGTMPTSLVIPAAAAGELIAEAFTTRNDWQLVEFAGAVFSADGHRFGGAKIRAEARTDVLIDGRVLVGL